MSCDNTEKLTEPTFHRTAEEVYRLAHDLSEEEAKVKIEAAFRQTVVDLYTTNSPEPDEELQVGICTRCGEVLAQEEAIEDPPKELGRATTRPAEGTIVDDELVCDSCLEPPSFAYQSPEALINAGADREIYDMPETLTAEKLKAAIDSMPVSRPFEAMTGSCYALPELPNDTEAPPSDRSVIDAVGAVNKLLDSEVLETYRHIETCEVDVVMLGGLVRLWRRSKDTRSSANGCPKCGGRGEYAKGVPLLSREGKTMGTDLQRATCERCDGTGTTDGEPLRFATPLSIHLLGLLSKLKETLRCL